MKVLVMVESKPNPKQENPNKKNRAMDFVKMIMDELTATGINYEINKAITKTSTVVTDGYRSYARLTEVVGNLFK